MECVYSIGQGQGVGDASFAYGGIAGATGHGLNLASTMRLPLLSAKVGVQDSMGLGHAGLSQGTE